MVVPGTELDFEVEKEVWNIYELHDGTTLKMRTFLTKIMRAPPRPLPPGAPSDAKEVGFDTSFNNTVVVHRSPVTLMGPPNTRPGPLEEAETIEVDFTPFSEEWNVYRISGKGIPGGLKIRVKLVVSSIIRAIGHFDQFGYPIYRVQSTNAIVPAVPKPRKRRK